MADVTAAENKKDERFKNVFEMLETQATFLLKIKTLTCFMFSLRGCIFVIVYFGER